MTITEQIKKLTKRQLNDLSISTNGGFFGFNEKKSVLVNFLLKEKNLVKITQKDIDEVK